MADALNRYSKRQKRNEITTRIAEIEYKHCLNCTKELGNDDCLKCPLQQQFKALGNELLLLSTKQQERMQSVVKRQKKTSKIAQRTIQDFIELKNEFLTDSEIAKLWDVGNSALNKWKAQNGISGKNWHKFI